jgi:hypothetical protein
MKSLIILALTVLSASAFAQGLKPFKPFNLEMSASIKTDNQKKFENSRIVMKALNKYRIEQSVGAQTIMTIANGRDVWEVRTITNECFHSIESAEKVAKVGKQTAQGVNPVEEIRKMSKPAGQAKIGGVMCRAYRRRDAAGMTHTIWVQPDGRIRRMVSSGNQRGAIAIGAPIQEHALESRVEYKWLDSGRIDDSLFRPPAGMKVTERAPSK